MKIALLVFVVAFSLSIALTILPLAGSTIFPTGPLIETIAITSAIHIFFTLIGLASFFAIFYFLAIHFKIKASKTTIIALFLGVILGPESLMLLDILLYGNTSGIYSVVATVSAVSGVFQFFFPALSAILFAELKEKRSSDNLTV